jgi:hypothetical protein
MDFVLFGRDRDKMVAMDYRGGTVLYDDALRAVSPLPRVKDLWYFSIFHPLSVSLPVGDDLFVMNNLLLRYASSTSVWTLTNQGHREPHMLWQPIPPPPYVKPEDDPAATVVDSAQSYTVVGESQVWISAESYGTYSLNMEDFWYDQEGLERRRGEWSKVGDWVLPFEGRAVYAPELSRWFGFSERDDSILCAVDLQQGAAQPPMVSDEWEGFKVPKAHYQAPIKSFLLHLGTSGRFCISKFSTKGISSGLTYRVRAYLIWSERI